MQPHKKPCPRAHHSESTLCRRQKIYFILGIIKSYWKNSGRYYLIKLYKNKQVTQKRHPNPEKLLYVHHGGELISSENRKGAGLTARAGRS